MRRTGLHSKHYPQWWKIESISPKVRNKTRVPTLTATIQHSFGSFSHSNQSRKRNKRNPNWKRRSKTLTVCRCIWNLIEPSQSLPKWQFIADNYGFSNLHWLQNKYLLLDFEITLIPTINLQESSIYFSEKVEIRERAC